MDTVFRLHGMPRTIVSTRDLVFVSNFWQEFFSLQGVGLHLSFAYHPQSDGQTETINKALECYLRYFCGDSLHQRSKWFHSSIQATPYKVVYGQPPPLYLPYFSGDSIVEAVDRSLTTRENVLLLLRAHLDKS